VDREEGEVSNVLAMAPYCVDRGLHSRGFFLGTAGRSADGLPSSLHDCALVGGKPAFNRPQPAKAGEA
jgi:hypothetical protein